MGILEGTYSGIREGPDDELWAFIDAYRLKPGFEEGADMVSLDISLACGYNENVECAVSGTENSTIHGNATDNVIERAARYGNYRCYLMMNQ